MTRRERFLAALMFGGLLTAVGWVMSLAPWSQIDGDTLVTAFIFGASGYYTGSRP